MDTDPTIPANTTIEAGDGITIPARGHGLSEIFDADKLREVVGLLSSGSESAAQRKARIQAHDNARRMYQAAIDAGILKRDDGKRPRRSRQLRGSRLRAMRRVIGRASQ